MQVPNGVELAISQVTTPISVKNEIQTSVAEITITVLIL